MDSFQELEDWLELREYAPASRATYRAMTGALFSWLESKGSEIGSCGTATLQEFLRARKVSPTTERRYLSLLSEFFEHLRENGKLDTNPASRLLAQRKRNTKGGRGKAPRRLPIALSETEAETLIAWLPTTPKAIADVRRKAMIMLLLGAGLRNNEACTLQWEHVELDGDAPRVRVIGKGDKERVVPMPEETVLAMLHWRDSAEATLRPAETLTGPVFFKGRFATPYTPSGMFRMVQTILVRAGIVKKRLSPHVLRHTFATRNLAAGCPLAVVKLWMGHDKVTTTAIYEHVVATPGGVKPRGFA